MPVAAPALSKYCETISRKVDSPTTLKLQVSCRVSIALRARLEMNISVIILMTEYLLLKNHIPKKHKYKLCIREAASRDRTEEKRGNVYFG
jgi:hypothetical protein